MKINKPAIKLLQILSLPALLMGGGCTAVLLDTVSHNIFIRDDTNFTEKNYAAADYLIQQAKTYINRYDTIVAQPLNDIDQPGMSSTFGKMIPEQVGVRLSQLGYHLNLEAVTLSPGTGYLHSKKTKKTNPDFVLTGTFMRQRTDMNVSIRIIDTHNDQIVAVFDYALPLTHEIIDLAQPKPKIIRMTK